MKLSDLIRKGVSGAVATATVATVATQRGSKAPTVANVATVAVANPPDRVMGGNPTVATVATVAVANPPQGGVAANAPTAAPASHWLLHYPDRDPVLIAWSAPVTHAEALADYPDAVAAEPVVHRPPPARRPPTEAERAELLALVQAVYATDTDQDRQEAMDCAMADPDGALTCYRAIAAERGLVVTLPAPAPAPPACRRCRHRAAPGRADPGYCAIRTDQPPAYGTDHPLYRLPGDGGTSCPMFESATMI